MAKQDSGFVLWHILAQSMAKHDSGYVLWHIDVDDDVVR